MAESHGKIYLYERILYMSFGLLASFIVFAIIISFSIKKQARRKNINEADFWTKESQANSVRRKSLDGLRYIHIPLEAFPTHLLNDDPDVMDCINILENLTAQKIVNLTGWSNTELKLEYGTANITALSEYDQNYTLLVRTLQKWADALLEAGHGAEASVLMQFAVSTQTDVSRTYYKLADYWISRGGAFRLDQLIHTAEALRSSNRDSILRHLRELL